MSSELETALRDIIAALRAQVADLKQWREQDKARIRDLERQLADRDAAALDSRYHREERGE